MVGYFFVFEMKLLLKVSQLIIKSIDLVLFHGELLLDLGAIVRHFLQLIFQLRGVEVLADVALGTYFACLLELFLESDNHLREILNFAFFIGYFLGHFSVIKHFGAFNAGLHAFHESVVLVFELLDVALQLLCVLE